MIYISLIFFIIFLIYFIITRGIFSPRVLILTHLILGLPLRYIYLSQNADQNLLAPWILNLNEAPIFSSILLICSYILFVFIFSTVISKISTQKNRLIQNFNLTDINITRLWIIFIVSLTFYGVSILYFFGSINDYISILSGRTSEGVAGFGYFGISFDLAAICGLVIYYYTQSYSTSKLNKIGSYFAILLIVIILALHNGRLLLLQYVLTILMIREFSNGVLPKFKLLYLIIPLLQITITVGGLSIRMAEQKNITLQEAQNETIKNLSDNILSPFALLDHYMISKKFVEVTGGFDYGYQYLTRLISPIPRSIWPEKPVGYGTQIREKFWGDTLGGIPPGLIGESYIAYGEFGMLIAAVFLGLTTLWLEKIYYQLKLNKGLIIFYATLVPYVAFYTLRGGIELAFMRLTIILATIYIIKVFATQKSIAGQK